MVPHRSLDDKKNIIAALLNDVHMTRGSVFNYSSFRKTLKKVCKRLHAEGEGFLTKSLPRLGKALDRALTGEKPMKAAEVQFLSQKDSELPLFLGEFFNRVFEPTGQLRQHPCVDSIRVLQDVLYMFYKYELPYTAEQEEQVLQKFERTEEELMETDKMLVELQALVGLQPATKRRHYALDKPTVVREARILLNKVFSHFDPTDIRPKHGPGVVATKQELWEKYEWSNVSHRITSVYPFDAYFCASQGHVCDSWREFSHVTDRDLPAKVILVPKDSRGPRLISCEPVDFQWVQQGLGRAITKLVEQHPLTRENVRFTDQEPNQFAALMGSKTGEYATLDLNEASDRVSLELVRLLFPEHITVYLEACRSSATTLPSGKILKLRKHAPMGSCLCFPVMALTVWAILTAAAPDKETRDSLYVYGDDVIVTTKFAVDAIEQLESFGLRVNRDKSCTSGFFRESCGVVAFAGERVTPLRLRTVWSSSPSADVYASWIAYANSYYKRHYYNLYDLIVANLHLIYGAIPSVEQVRCVPSKDGTTCPSLIVVSDECLPRTYRVSKRFQRRLLKVRIVKARTVRHTSSGWVMLLRHLIETDAMDATQQEALIERRSWSGFELEYRPFSVSSYTLRRTSKLVWCWR
jgi:hypothetical protein